MRKIKVKMEKVQTLAYPQRCPCCLNSPASTPTRLVRGGAIVYTATWPHCEACARNESRRSRSLFGFQALAVFGLIVLAIGTPVLFAMSPVSGFDGYVALGLGIALPIASIVFHKRYVSNLSRPDNAVRTGAGVMIDRCGAHLLGGGFVLDVTFLQEAYAREFIDLNRQCITKVLE